MCYKILLVKFLTKEDTIYLYVLSCNKLVGNRWVRDAGIDQLEFARVMPSDLFIFMAAAVFPAESYNASIAWTQNSILTTVVDDLFDGGGSIDELRNLVALIEEYDTVLQLMS
jgi:hypothetical protein